MSSAEEVKFSLKVMINEEKTKVLFAESDSHFVDVLLSFLTLPLGRIVKILEKHYGDEAPIIGCLNTFYNSVANLDSDHFWTEGAKLILLNPMSSFDRECRWLKLDISDSRLEFFSCSQCPKDSFWSVSAYYNEVTSCRICKNNGTMKKIREAKRPSLATLSNGGFTEDTTTFIITDDLQIIPNDIGILEALSFLDITRTDNVELMNVTLGLSEIMNLLKASLISPAPLSALIFNKTRQMNTVEVESEEEVESSEEEVESSEESEEEVESEAESSSEIDETPDFKKMTLKVTVQNSTNKILFAQGREDFIEFLLSFLTIPLGGVKCLLENETSIISIENLHRSVSEFLGDEYFKSSNIKERLIKPNLPHGYISKNQILPLIEESLPDAYKLSLISSSNFPQGQGKYIKGPRTYLVFDDLTVMPFYISSAICSLNQLKVPVYDVRVMEVQIGLEEALCILEASLTSDSALTNGLLNHITNEQQNPES